MIYSIILFMNLFFIIIFLNFGNFIILPMKK